MSTCWLIFLAFGIKCPFPLLHNWLQDAYPQATVTGTVFLSAFTTKLAVYALARGFAGTPELIWIGAIMTALPIFIRRHRERSAARFALQPQQPAWLHGGGHRRRYRTCSERHRRARVLPHSLKCPRPVASEAPARDFQGVARNCWPHLRASGTILTHVDRRGVKDSLDVGSRAPEGTGKYLNPVAKDRHQRN